MGVYVTLYVLNREAYDNRLLPAYRSFFQSGGLQPLLDLIQQAKVQPPDSPDDAEIWAPDLNFYHDILSQFSGGGAANLQADVDWDNGMRRPLREIVRQNLSPILLRFLCLIRRENHVLQQAVCQADLMQYLYQHSDWLESFFTFSFGLRGGRLEIPWGESTELLSVQQANQLLQELLKVPARADTSMQQQLENLQELVRLALSASKLSVAMVVS